MNAGDLKKMAQQYGADLTGIGSIDRFSMQPPERSPLSIFPECQSVLVLGRRVLRGALRGVEEGTNFDSTYGMFGYQWLEDNFLAQTTYDLTCWIEEQGFEAVPLFGYNEEGMPKGRPVSPDKPAPNVYVDMHYAALAAGLGEMGLADVFLTPEFGPRQRFALILTDAELEADAVQTKHICANCNACVDACPFGAIDPENMKTVGVPGYEMDVATVDYSVCSKCPNGAMSRQGTGSRPDRLAAACIRTCMVQLEKSNKCTNSFAQPFRKRKPWLLDGFSRSVESPVVLPGCDGTAKRRS